MSRLAQYKNLYAVPKESFDAFVKHKAGSFPNVKSLKVNQLNFNDAKQIKPQHMGANAFTKSGKTISVVNTGENESRLSAPGSLNDTSTSSDIAGTNTSQADTSAASIRPSMDASQRNGEESNNTGAREESNNTGVQEILDWAGVSNGTQIQNADYQQLENAAETLNRINETKEANDYLAQNSVVSSPVSSTSISTPTTPVTPIVTSASPVSTTTSSSLITSPISEKRHGASIPEIQNVTSTPRKARVRPLYLPDSPIARQSKTKRKPESLYKTILNSNISRNFAKSLNLMADRLEASADKLNKTAPVGISTKRKKGLNETPIVFRGKKKRTENNLSQSVLNSPVYQSDFAKELAAAKNSNLRLPPGQRANISKKTNNTQVTKKTPSPPIAARTRHQLERVRKENEPIAKRTRQVNKK